MLVSESTP